ncbi:MAG: NAD(P)-dependent oxidoreductase [Bacteroidota bacterium]
MSTRNQLYPIFLRPEHLNILVIGGGNVALEKLTFLYKSSPQAHVTIVAPEWKTEVLELITIHGGR